jgi:hypothetical protein
MKRPNAGTLLAAATLSVAVGIGVAQLELAGHPESDIWPNGWLVGGLAIAGLLIVISVAGPIIDLTRRRTVTPSDPETHFLSTSGRTGIRTKDTDLKLNRARIVNQNTGIDTQGGSFSGTDVNIE